MESGVKRGPGIARREQCPLCGAAISTPALNWYGQEFLRCLTCDLVYMREVDTDIARIYDIPYSDKHETEAIKTERRNWYKQYLADWVKGGVLELGPGDGTLLGELVANGFDAMGAEILAETAAHLRAKGAPVIQHDIESAPIEGRDGRFDYVVSFHVFEHFLYPKPALINMIKSLKPGGRLFVYMPSIEKYFNHPDRQKGWVHLKMANQEPPNLLRQHINFLTRRTVSYIAGKYGMEITRMGDAISAADDFYFELCLKR